MTSPSPGHSRHVSQASITTASSFNSNSQYDENLLTVPGQSPYHPTGSGSGWGANTSDAGSYYAHSSAGDSPGGDISPDQSYSLGVGDGGASLRRSVSASSATSANGRRGKHVSQACDSCKSKKTKCDGNQPCNVCERAGLKCTTTSKDNRKTPNKAYVASLERDAANWKKRAEVEARQLASMKQKVAALEERLKNAGLYGEGVAASVGGSGSSGGTAGAGAGAAGGQGEAKGLSIVIPQAKRQGSGDGEAAELLGMGEKLVRDRSGSLTAYAGPSPLAHLATSPPPVLPSSPPIPDPQVPKLGWSSITVPVELQVHAVQNFFHLSGTELLPLADAALHLLEWGLSPSSPPAAMPHQQPLNTPAFYNALMANALAFLPPQAGILRSNIQNFAAQAQDIGPIFAHQGIGNVLGLGLLAQYCAHAGEFDIGWQYAGMSARMMQSLGLHLDFARGERDMAWASMSPQEKQLRATVYWIVYIQDKLWYLWVGRTTAVQDNPEVALPPAEDETHEPSLIFRALCQLMRIAARIMPDVYGQERCEDMGVIDAHRLALDSWLNDQPDLLKPTPKAMETASLSLRHLHMVYHWLRILLDRPFYRQITQQLAQETGVTRTDASLRAIMNLLGPWDSHLARPIAGQPLVPAPLPLTPQLSQIVLTTGITWLHSAVAFHKFSKKRKDEGVEKARTCLRLLHEQGQRQFSGMLRRLMRKYFTSVEIAEAGMLRNLNAGMTGLGINAASANTGVGPAPGAAGGAHIPPGGIAVPVLPQFQMSPPADGDGGQPIFSQEPATFEPGNTNLNLAMGTLTAFPPDLLSPPQYSPISSSPIGSGVHTPLTGNAPLFPATAAQLGWAGPNMEMVDYMSEYMTANLHAPSISPDDPSQPGAEAPTIALNNVGMTSGFVPDWVQQQQQQQQQQEGHNPYMPVYHQEPEDYAMDNTVGAGFGMQGQMDEQGAQEFRDRFGQKTIVPEPGVTRGVSPGNVWPGRG